MNRRQMFGNAVAIAAATLVLANSAQAGDEKKADKKADKKIKCLGGNECKGKGACGNADGTHNCGGKNECKGKGWSMVATADECTKAGGKVAEEKKDKKS